MVIDCPGLKAIGIGRLLKPPCIYREDREIYLNIVDLDPSPVNSINMDTGEEKRKEHPCPHAFVEEVLNICKSRVMEALGQCSQPEPAPTTSRPAPPAPPAPPASGL